MAPRRAGLAAGSEAADAIGRTVFSCGRPGRLDADWASAFRVSALRSSEGFAVGLFFAAADRVSSTRVGAASFFAASGLTNATGASGTVAAVAGFSYIAVLSST